MRPYLQLASKVLGQGTRKTNRTGVDTIACFAQLFDHPLHTGFPLLTTKRMSFDSVAAELLWFLSGDSKITQLNKHTGIWKPWSDEHDNVPYAYGEYWRRYPVYPREENSSEHLDQLQGAIDTLKKSPDSRRAVVVAWDPRRASKSKLPPCHYTFVLGLWSGKLNVHVTMRSADLAVGVPYNIASYALLTHLIAKELKVQPGRIAITMVDCHVYVCNREDPGANDILNGRPRHLYDHTAALRKQITREPKELPMLDVKVDSISEALDIAYGNPERIGDVFRLRDYHPHPHLPMQVAV